MARSIKITGVDNNDDQYFEDTTYENVSGAIEGGAYVVSVSGSDSRRYIYPLHIINRIEEQL